MTQGVHRQFTEEHPRMQKLPSEPLRATRREGQMCRSQQTRLYTVYTPVNGTIVQILEANLNSNTLRVEINRLYVPVNPHGPEIYQFWTKSESACCKREGSDFSRQSRNQQATVLLDKIDTQMRPTVSPSSSREARKAAKGKWLPHCPSQLALHP